MKDLGLPDDILTFVNYPTRFDCRETTRRSRAAASSARGLRDYAWVLWDYWERHLDPGPVHRPHAARPGGRQGGADHRRIIGHRAGGGAQVAEAGAITIVCGRDQDKLDEACKEAKARARVGRLSGADIADMEDCDRMVQWLNDNHGGVDFLVNNAGRSIRRGIENSYERFHDFERCMQLNYFGALRVTMGLLPGMVAKRKGHVSTSRRSAC
jgi:hypothetical protein